MATSKWTNYFSSTRGTMIDTTGSGSRHGLTDYTPTATQYKRLRHLKMSIVGQVDTTGGLVAAMVCFWKGSAKLDATTLDDLDLTDTAIFRRIPIALTDSNSYRFSTSWPKVSIDEDERFQVFLTYSGSNTIGGAPPQWVYSYTMTAMENLRTM